MKFRFNAIAIVSVLLLMAACKKDKPVPETHIKPRHVAYGTVSVNRNGKPWPMRIYGVRNVGSSVSPDSAFLLAINRYADVDGDSIIRDVLNIGNIRFRQYSGDLEYYNTSPTYPYALTNTAEYCFSSQHFDDGDVVAFTDGLLLSDPHFIEITSYNPDTKEVSGRFAASFLSHNQKDTLRWTDGVFSTKIFPE